MIIDRKTEVLKETLSHCNTVHHISHGLHWEGTRTSTIRIENWHVLAVNLSLAVGGRKKKMKAKYTSECNILCHLNINVSLYLKNLNFLFYGT